jgi:hypothetical protein
MVTLMLTIKRIRAFTIGFTRLKRESRLKSALKNLERLGLTGDPKKTQGKSH